MHRAAPLVLIASLAAGCAPSAPVKTVACADIAPLPMAGRVTDQGDMLAPDQQAKVEAALADYEQTTGRQMAIATIASLNGARIDNYAHCLGNRWGIGDVSKHDGVLIVLAKAEQQIRIATGVGSEAMLTDDEAREVIDMMAPQFRKGNIAAGLTTGISRIAAEMGRAS